MTTYVDIAKRMLNKIIDYKIGSLTEDEAYQVLLLRLDSAIVKFHFCRKDLYDLKGEEGFNEDLTNIEQEIIVLYLLLEYIDSEYIRTPDKLSTYFASTDLNIGSAWNHLGQIREIRQIFSTEVETLCSRYTWHDEKVFETIITNNGVRYAKFV